MICTTCVFPFFSNFAITAYFCAHTPDLNFTKQALVQKVNTCNVNHTFHTLNVRNYSEKSENDVFLLKMMLF